jgi:hypothetical protein
MICPADRPGTRPALRRAYTSRVGERAVSGVTTANAPIGQRMAVGTRSAVHSFGDQHVAKVPLAGTPDS